MVHFTDEELEAREIKKPAQRHTVDEKARSKARLFGSDAFMNPGLWIKSERSWFLMVFCLITISVEAVLLSSFSGVRLSVAPWTVAHQAPLSMGFFRQEYWSELPFPPPGDLPDPGIEHTSPVSPEWQADSSLAELSGKPP